MAKFRQNHTKNRKSGNSFMTRIVIFTVLLIGAIFGGSSFLNDFFNNSGSSQSGGYEDSSASYDGSNSQTFTSTDDSYLPSKTDKNQLVRHQYYTLSYNEKYEIPEWVAYELTRKSLEAKNVKRAKRFKSDPDVKSKSAKHSDYTHSGYTRGHLAPAGDMAFNETAMQESFYMSNMTPQIRPFNNGIWKELEETVRDWAYDKGSIYVVSGPIMDGISDQIGNNKIGVPKSFYKVIVDENDGIAFEIPHDRVEERLETFAMSIDDLEKETGIDFFQGIDDAREQRIESSFNINKWKLDNKRYRLRVEKWNKE